MSNPIPLSHPDITDEDVHCVIEALRSGRLSNGPQLEDFERLIAQRVQRIHAIGVSSGTAGLHLALAAMEIGPGDEVITPAFSFVASANCIEYVGAKPVFVDCDPRTLNVRAAAVERHLNEKTKAVIGVEIFGNPASMAQLAALCAKHEIPLIEDGCQGFGGRTGRQLVGQFGRASIFAFYPNKQITTGEGGMIVTDDDRLAELFRSMRNHGRPAGGGQPDTDLGSRVEHERLGYNYRMSELSAALGASQMRRLDELLDARQRVAEAYTRRLMGNADLILPTVEPDTVMGWFVYVVRLSDRFSEQDRDSVIEGLRRHDVGASNYFPPIPLLPHYRQKYGYKPGDFPVAEFVAHRTIALPFFPRLTEREVDLVCQTLELMMSRITFARQP